MLWRNGAELESVPEDRYRFGHGLVVSIQGDRRARAHFRSEYASAAVATDSSVPALEVNIGARVHHRGHSRRVTHESELHGAHKLARWRASMAIGRDLDHLGVAVDVRGPLGLTLVQGYVVEPLVSLAAVHAGSVLLPSAAIERDGKALLLIGHSRSGKSSLAARALAAGLRILGDDQVLIDASHDCHPFPRRLRVYPDLAWTAPAAFAALRPFARGVLGALSGLKSLTRGFVAPPLRISASALGAGISPTCLPIGEIVVIRRAPVDVLTIEPLDHDELGADAEDVLRSQRSQIFSLAALRAASATVLARERAIIGAALATVPAQRVLVPASWPADQAIGRLAQELRLER
jgi:hypothetical protein